MLLSESAESDSLADDDERAVPGTSLFYRWKTKKRNGFDRTSRVWLAFVRDYVKEHNPKDLESLISEMSARESSVKKLSETTRKSCYTQDAITLANGDEVATSKHSWNKAEEFADAAKEFGYQINSCHIVNIGEGASRSWKDSRRYRFISAGGTQSYHTQIRNLREGDFVFAKWAQDAPVRGCIACGKVVAKATPIAEFKIADGKLLLDCETESGEKFRDKYRSALEREYPDLASPLNGRRRIIRKIRFSCALPFANFARQKSTTRTGKNSGNALKSSAKRRGINDPATRPRTGA